MVTTIRIVLCALVVTFGTTVGAQQTFPGPQLESSMVAPVSYMEELASYGIGAPEALQKSGDCSCGKSACCCRPMTQHTSGFFGEFLYLRMLDSEVTFAAPVNGPVIAPPGVSIQSGRLGVTDFDAQPGFRVGFDVCLDECSSIRASYSYFESQTNDTVQTAPGQFIAPMLLHPSSTNAGSNALAATGSYGVDWEQADVMYRAVLAGGCDWVLNYEIGARYLHMDQELAVVYTLGGSDETVANSIAFDGGGLTLGLDFARKFRRCWLIYSRGSLGFLAGDFRGAYAQGSNFDASIVDARWRAGRLVTAADFEIGTGLESKCGRYRATVGFLLGGWSNIVSTDEYIQAVRGNNFVGLEDQMSMAGLTTRIECNW